jgi:XTP/dITP diphosphohydrolase
LRLLARVAMAERTARFRCVLAVRRLLFSATARKLIAMPPPTPILFEGICEGRISEEPSGHGGFGYDPLFMPLGRHQSFAELGDEVKNSLSHRAHALKKLRRFLTSRP